MTGSDEAVLFCDADNTLWDTDAVFAEAQLDMLGLVEARTGVRFPGENRLAFIRSIDQALAARHHAGLRYPPRLLAHATALVLDGNDIERATRQAELGPRNKMVIGQSIAETIEQQFIKMVRRLPALRKGVLSGLQTLHDLDVVVFIITEGARQRAMRTAAALGVTNLTDRLIEAPKRTELYRRVLRLRRNPKTAFMVGDQLDRDIAPAKAAGLETIYFPGGFVPRWAPDIDAVRPANIINSFDEVPGIICRRIRGEQAVAE